MTKDTHSDGDKIGQFCTMRKAPCSCKNNYEKICEPSWAGWTYPQWKETAPPRADETKYNAHHVVGIAMATKLLSKDEKIEMVVKTAKWCINKGRNMIALPCFAHTVHWYCNNARKQVDPTMGEPPFADLPNHTIDHNRFLDEVENEIKDLAGEIQEAGHGYRPSNLKEELNKISSKYKAELRRRGRRLGGTHAGWREGLLDPDSLWYVPFSMASDDDILEMPFPARNFDSKVAKTLDRLALSFWGPLL